MKNFLYLIKNKTWFGDICSFWIYPMHISTAYFPAPLNWEMNLIF
jgi:hypothetical protein